MTAKAYLRSFEFALYLLSAYLLFVLAFAA